MFILRNHRNSYFVGHALIRVWALLFCSSLGALAQSTAPPVNASAPFSIPATHLLGLENTKSNCNGTLSIQGDALQFQQGGKPGTEVKITSIHAVFLGGESKQVGGVPMKLGKAAAPFGSGRVVSLFAHKKYDTLTLKYVDSDGGVHGAIFQLSQGTRRTRKGFTKGSRRISQFWRIPAYKTKHCRGHGMKTIRRQFIDHLCSSDRGDHGCISGLATCPNCRCEILRCK